MRKHFILCMVFFLWLPMSNAQTTEGSESYEIFIQKKRTNNTWGWVMLGAGSAMVLTGAMINLEDGILDDDATNNSKGLWLSYLGGATTLASIPLFIAAGKNRKRAELALKQNMVSAPFTPFKSHQVSLALKIDLN